MNKLTEIKQKYAEPQVWAGDPEDVRYLLSLLEEKDKALDKCFIAGNSLASVIIGYELPEEHHYWTYEQASTYFYDKHKLDRDIAYIRYETWLAWKALREVSEEVTSSNNEGD